jgi:hypothetical protein
MEANLTSEALASVPAVPSVPSEPSPPHPVRTAEEAITVAIARVKVLNFMFIAPKHKLLLNHQVGGTNFREQI